MLFRNYNLRLILVKLGLQKNTAPPKLIKLTQIIQTTHETNFDKNIYSDLLLPSLKTLFDLSQFEFFHNLKH